MAEALFLAQKGKSERGQFHLARRLQAIGERLRELSSLGGAGQYYGTHGVTVKVFPVDGSSGVSHSYVTLRSPIWVPQILQFK